MNYQSGWVNPEHIKLTDFSEEDIDKSAAINFVKYEYEGIKRITPAAYLFIITGYKRGIWIPKALCLGMQVDPITKKITVYVADYCNSKEVDL